MHVVTRCMYHVICWCSATLVNLFRMATGSVRQSCVECQSGVRHACFPYYVWRLCPPPALSNLQCTGRGFIPNGLQQAEPTVRSLMVHDITKQAVWEERWREASDRAGMRELGTENSKSLTVGCVDLASDINDIELLHNLRRWSGRRDALNWVSSLEDIGG